MNHPKKSCFIFVALHCEAKVFISQFNLVKNPKYHPFALYDNEEFVLVITGVGKIAMASAVAYSLAHYQSTKNPVLVNIGVAGHKTATLGDLFFVHKIIDADTKKTFYPQFLVKNICRSKSLYTVSAPETDYQKGYLYDMEASGFYETANRFTTTELVHVFKVVSDNQNSNIGAINAKKINDWLFLKSEKIAKIIESLRQLALSLDSRKSVNEEELLQRYHFSVSSQQQLKNLLHRWCILSNYEELDIFDIEFKNGKEILHWLQQKIDEETFNL